MGENATRGYGYHEGFIMASVNHSPARNKNMYSTEEINVHTFLFWSAWDLVESSTNYYKIILKLGDETVNKPS